MAAPPVLENEEAGLLPEILLSLFEKFCELMGLPQNNVDLFLPTHNGLKNFNGTVLLSTHDNTFAQTVGDRVIELTPKGAIDRLLKFDDYMKDLSLKETRAKFYN